MPAHRAAGWLAVGGWALAVGLVLGAWLFGLADNQEGFFYSIIGAALVSILAFSCTIAWVILLARSLTRDAPPED